MKNNIIEAKMMRCARWDYFDIDILII